MAIMLDDKMTIRKKDGSIYQCDMENYQVLKAGLMPPMDLSELKPYSEGERYDVKRTFLDGSIYEGEVTKGKADGKGKLILSDGSIYEGYMVHGKIKYPDGTFQYPNGDFLTFNFNSDGKRLYPPKVFRKTNENGVIYAGHFTEDAKNLIYKVIYQDGSYTEHIVNNELNTSVKYEDCKKFPDGSIDEGEMRNCKGKFILSDDSIYEGEMRNGKAHGKGKLTLLDGSSCEGEFLEGKKHGIMKYTLNCREYQKITFNNDIGYGDDLLSTQINIGHIDDLLSTQSDIGHIDDLPNQSNPVTTVTKLKDCFFEIERKIDALRDRGRFVYDNGDYFDGEFSITSLGLNKCVAYNGRKKFPDGSIYEGEFLKDKKHGKGKLILSDGSIYEGEFLKDKKHGKGKLTLPDGLMYEGEFQDDDLICGRMIISQAMTISEDKSKDKSKDTKQSRMGYDEARNNCIEVSSEFKKKQQQQQQQQVQTDQSERGSNISGLKKTYDSPYNKSHSTKQEEGGSKQFQQQSQIQQQKKDFLFK
ncbi:MORN repeat-containing protein [Candidatus Deianiraea vastatrix]|uniref:MORN repeat kinase n=1 Tax=Candidatus Deianiraea vastatrix TaxID=2163644 RepID=A0A5B8XE16_9RICK|nr:hypothetical protein [Candidatus Deianiraea vastatrix]QED23552.1 Putative MORN repeat kinase [Candidatus Deianiraea vastatrix]